MMTRDQADSMLREAIQAHADAFRLSRDDEMLSEYAIVACWQPQVEDGVSRYTTHFHMPSVPLHSGLGLFDIGARLIWEGDDE